MTEQSIERYFLINLQRAVPESSIFYESPNKGALPFCIVDGKRQVICLEHHKGYDLWVPQRKPEPGNEMTCSDFDVSFE